MNPSRIFIQKPIATSLLMVAIFLVGIFAYRLLPVSALPEVDYPSIEVVTLYPGANPDVVSTHITAPLERQFGQMPSLHYMQSTSSGGASVITLGFSLDIALDVAEQEVQAAINAANNLLPKDLPMPPLYSKINPADAPILTLAITSPSLPMTQLHEWVQSKMVPQLSQVMGVGLVNIAGGRKPAIRIQANAQSLQALNVSLDDISKTITAANINQAKGSFDGKQRASTIQANDQLQTVEDYKNLIISWKNGAALRLKELATVVEGAENKHLAAWSNQQPAIILNIQKQAGANIIGTVDRLQTVIAQLHQTLPKNIQMQVMADRTQTIRASIRDIQFELYASIALVVVLMYIFLGSVRAAIIPSVAVPISLVGSLSVIYALGFSINNLSLMALTIATGFVVDDAIVMVENISSHIEKGLSPMQAALKGSKQMGFTIISLTLSLIAVLIPLWFMQDVLGRLFHEFAATLAVSILISAAVSLTLTPMMSARLLQAHTPSSSRFGQMSARAMHALIALYARVLNTVLAHAHITLCVFFLSIVGTAWLYIVVAKGLFPMQDTGFIQVITEAAPHSSFAAMAQHQQALADTILEDENVEGLTSFIGVDGSNPTMNTGRMQITLKPFAQRTKTSAEIIRQLQKNTESVVGIRAYMQAVQDLSLDTRPSKTQYQFLLSSPNRAELEDASIKLLKELQKQTEFTNVASDLQNAGQQAYVEINRDAASRLGVDVASIDSALYNAFGQRPISTIYTQSGQYRVIIEMDAKTLAQQGIQSLENIMIPSNLPNQSANGNSNGIKQHIALGSVAKIIEKPAALSINHVAQFPAVVLSFNLAPHTSLDQAVAVIQSIQNRMHFPASISANFQGAAQIFHASLQSTLWLIAAAILSMYIILGVLYESYIHPLTILSTLPSAGLGALLALYITDQELDMIAVIGIILLIGIVKKNAIMMIDFALDAQRTQQLSPHDAIYQACLQRFRPILMTTIAALFSALPLMFGTGVGHELRHPLGITMVGGLLVSQVLTLLSTPVIYVFFAQKSEWFEKRKERRQKRQSQQMQKADALDIDHPNEPQP